MKTGLSFCQKLILTLALLSGAIPSIAATTIEAPAPAQLSAWVGVNDTLIKFSPEFNGYDFYRSTRADCDLTNYATCAYGQKTLLNGAIVVDTSASKSRSAHYILQKSNVKSKTISTKFLFTQPYYPGTRDQTVSFKNKLWVVGGMCEGAVVWSSSDGMRWNEETSAAGFSNRHGHQVVVFNNKMWVIGGVDANDVNKNDVWSSVDGKNWIEETDNAGFPARQYHQAIAFNGKLWVIGGMKMTYNATKQSWIRTHFNDVWSSMDGISWIQETGAAAFAPRYGHQVVSLRNKLWLIGGHKAVEWSPRNINDVSHSIDSNEVWSSSDGVIWTLKTPSTPFPARYLHSAEAFAGKLWVIGGMTQTGLVKRDIWSSSDGNNWVKAKTGLPISSVEAVVFANKLIVVPNNSLGLFSTNDGINWREGFKGEINFQQMVSAKVQATESVNGLMSTLLPNQQIWENTHESALAWDIFDYSSAIFAPGFVTYILPLSEFYNFTEHQFLYGADEGKIHLNPILFKTSTKMIFNQETNTSLLACAEKPEDCSGYKCFDPSIRPAMCDTPHAKACKVKFPSEVGRTFTHQSLVLLNSVKEDITHSWKANKIVPFDSELEANLNLTNNLSLEYAGDYYYIQKSDNWLIDTVLLSFDIFTEKFTWTCSNRLTSYAYKQNVCGTTESIAK